jgi:phosphonopyruvate decarboxylase
MVHADSFLASLAGHGFDVVSGVPCSYLTPLINAVIDSERVSYVGAANEGQAVAVACGAELGGRHAVAMFQNSGLGNAINPLTSLTEPFALPMLVITTWRGQPGRPKDEPQHKVMGEITPGLLELMGIPWESFPETEAEVEAMLGRVLEEGVAKRRPYALILSKGGIEGPMEPRGGGAREAPGVADPPAPLARQTVHHADDVLARVQQCLRPTDAVIATTGFTGRALYAVGDRPNQLYMVGSMGCASSFAQGLALAQPGRRIVVLDGDGAALMHMGAFATLGRERPSNLLHVLLDNGVHDSTGGQSTVSRDIDLPAVAAACGYPRVVRVDGLGDLEAVLAQTDDVLTLAHVCTDPRKDRKLPRPTLTPAQVGDRFRAWLDGAS